MSGKTKIEWTEVTWNPVTGCTKISDGCLNCYAYTLAKRLKAMGNPRYAQEFNVTLQNDILTIPLKWKTPKMIFVNSMSDLFHEDVPDDYIKEVFKTMNKAHWHTFQVLTKRPERLAKIAAQLDWSDNIWQGVTVESQKYIDRIDLLRKIPAKIKFLSFEPLISNIEDVDLTDIDWVIVGGESGKGSRKMDPAWVDSIKSICENFNTPFFFKQWGGFNKKKNGRLFRGKTWDEYPRMKVD